ERLRQRDIPEARQLLRDQHDNLHRVAEYCHNNYLQAGDKRKALEETMALSTQSLASVTYQVSSLATAFLRLLDLQAAQLRRVEADIACVAQRVDIHKEKVSRREIGTLTVSRRFPTCQKIVAPPNPPVLEPYYRKPLNFSALDHIGHGIKDTSTQLSRTGTLARKSTKSSSAQAAGTLGRSRPHPDPAAPPPSSSGAPVAPGEGIPAPPALPGPSLPAPSPPGPPPPPAAAVPPPPPPPLPEALLPPPAGDPAVPSPDLLPPAPDDLELPPPPPPAVPGLEEPALPPPPAAEDPPWAPESYLEKVVALYPYRRQKDNELSLEPGALLFVTRRFSDGWCQGVMGQEEGFFPGNYVEPF
ncbi:ABI3 protein, partial [Rhipidura dahli]|nr:ABI3 protein [Rhipidura dahli]